MKVTTFKTLACVLLVTAAFSCKKSSDDAPAKSKTEYLTQKPWKVQDAGIDANANGSIDAGESTKNMMDACELDNTITFKSDKTSVVDEGGSKCDAGDPQTAQYTWSFDANETNLTTNDPVITALSNGTAKVLALDDNTLKLSVNGSIGPISVVYLLVLQH
jgi:hypothetical protein